MENASSMKKETRVTILNFLPNTLENLSHTKQKPMQNTTEEVNSLIKEKFLCQSKFAQDIEYLVATSKINYIEAIVTYCEENGIEFESVSKLISKPLKEKIKCEATQLNFLKKTSRAKLMF
jgi:hypothetical protein